MSGQDFDIDVLIPTCDRAPELAVTLSGLAAQSGPRFRVVVSDQSGGAPSYDSPTAQAMVRVLRHQGRPVELGRHLPRRGLAEHRGHLLGRSDAPYVLFLDDDVWLEPGALARMHEAIRSLRCGFVGSAVQGLSFTDDHRPEELAPYEEWQGPVRPERVRPGDPAWNRWTLHNAANPTHLAERLGLRPGEWRAYKVAWVGGCVLYDREVLLRAGGFDFWSELPSEHCGEDVVAQQRVMALRGGAGLLPSGAVHLESPTTVTRRDVDAPLHLDRSGRPAGGGGNGSGRASDRVVPPASASRAGHERVRHGYS